MEQWYIYLHEWLVFMGKCRYIYHTWMLWVNLRDLPCNACFFWSMMVNLLNFIAHFWKGIRHLQPSWLSGASCYTQLGSKWAIEVFGITYKVGPRADRYK